MSADVIALPEVARWNAKRQSVEFGVEVGGCNLCEDSGSGANYSLSGEGGPDEQGGIGHDLVGCSTRRMRGFVARRCQRGAEPRRRVLRCAKYRHRADQPLGGGGPRFDASPNRSCAEGQVTRGQVCGDQGAGLAPTGESRRSPGLPQTAAVDRGRVKTRNRSDYAQTCSNGVRIGDLKIRVERSAGLYVAQSGSLPEFSHGLDPSRPFAHSRRRPQLRGQAPAALR